MGKTNYTIQMDEEKRDQWKEHVEDNTEYSTISQLVRSAVKEQIQRDNREDDDLTKEQKIILNRIQSENARVIDLIENVQAIAEEIEGKQITLSDHETITTQVVHQENQRLLREFSGVKDE